MNLAIELVLLLATPVLYMHARASRSRAWADSYWIFGGLFGLTRALFLVEYVKLYSFTGYALTAQSFPVVELVLWSNLAYIALVWSENLLGRDYLKASFLDQHQPVIFLVMVSLALMLETAFAQYGMISWHVDSARPLWEGVPLLAPFAYGLSGSLMLKGFKMIKTPSLKQHPSAIWRYLIPQPIIVLILLGLLLIINTLIILSFPD